MVSRYGMRTSAQLRPRRRSGSFRRSSSVSTPAASPTACTDASGASPRCACRCAWWGRSPRLWPGRCRACPPPSCHVPRWPPGTAELGQRATARPRSLPVSEMRVARAGLGKLGHDDDVAGLRAVHVGGLLAHHDVQMAKALLLARARVDELHARGSSVPERTFRKLRRPTNGSDDRLEDEGGGALASRRCAIVLAVGHADTRRGCVGCGK